MKVHYGLKDEFKKALLYEEGTLLKHEEDDFPCLFIIGSLFFIAVFVYLKYTGVL